MGGRLKRSIRHFFSVCKVASCFWVKQRRSDERQGYDVVGKLESGDLMSDASAVVQEGRDCYTRGEGNGLLSKSVYLAKEARIVRLLPGRGKARTLFPEEW
jgi:hypothetical protein